MINSSSSILFALLDRPVPIASRIKHPLADIDHRRAVICGHRLLIAGLGRESGRHGLKGPIQFLRAPEEALTKFQSFIFGSQRNKIFNGQADVSRKVVDHHLFNARMSTKIPFRIVQSVP